MNYPYRAKDGIKLCPSCMKSKSVNEYYNASTSHDGYFNYCKKCADKRRQKNYYANVEKRREHSRTYQKSPHIVEYHREFSRKARKLYPEKIACRDRVYKAIKSGEITRGSCEECGKPNAQAHHKDYSKPYEIKWLCPACHTKEHLYGIAK